MGTSKIVFEGHRNGEALAVFYETAVRTGDVAEVLIGTVMPREKLGQRISSKEESSFVVRSHDNQFKVKVTITASGHAEHPYHISFFNAEAGVNSKAVELMYLGEEKKDHYIWIEPTDKISHFTDAIQKFTLRDNSNKKVFSIVIYDLDSDERIER